VHQQQLRERDLPAVTSRSPLRIASCLAAALVATSLVGCQLIIGLDDYYLAPTCPSGAALCTVCNDASDCDPPEACHTWSCVAHLCQPIDAAPGTPCAKGVCSDASPSTCVACNEDGDCDPGGHCYKSACFRCDDGVQNGDEWEKDCGGACPRCLGDPCSTPQDCQSGFCADGRCCKGACTDVCTRCDLDGDCKNIEKYQTDNAPECLMGMVCDGGGGCRTDNGFQCVGSAQCASFNCVNGICKPAP
jgi:hypothetical protein